MISFYINYELHRSKNKINIFHKSWVICSERNEKSPENAAFLGNSSMGIINLYKKCWSGKLNNAKICVGFVLIFLGLKNV
jgi:hypothetical protein